MVKGPEIKSAIGDRRGRMTRITERNCADEPEFAGGRQDDDISRLVDIQQQIPRANGRRAKIGP